MKKIIKVLAASALVCLMAVTLTTNTTTNLNTTTNSNSVDLLNFSLKNAQADGENAGNHSHGPKKLIRGCIAANANSCS
ncbi:hypothetical protein [Flavivirga jejuensis]|uniref:Uncharacterized protein n=1 Tax=Flavivirga jejuensis TaxID=870487 RepID=A0ABT8WS14_9FLAO|nr:hypothetical protein [Flavivirga jejuensis]MDO5975936.1 hypothetical protein [Flavivirga jejuensis]